MEKDLDNIQDKIDGQGHKSAAKTKAGRVYINLI